MIFGLRIKFSKFLYCMNTTAGNMLHWHENIAFVIRVHLLFQAFLPQQLCKVLCTQKLQLQKSVWSNYRSVGSHVAHEQNLWPASFFTIDCCVDATVGNFDWNMHNIF